MSIEEILSARSGSACELCGNTNGLKEYKVAPVSEGGDKSILVCETCREKMSGATATGDEHWHCLNTSMWSTVPAVQVMAWRILDARKNEGWAQDLLDILYLDDETLAWAKQAPLTGNKEIAEEKIIHKDSNGNVLQAGDSVV